MESMGLRNQFLSESYYALAAVFDAPTATIAVRLMGSKLSSSLNLEADERIPKLTCFRPLTL